MSSVRKKDQSPHRFTPIDLLLDVYNHTSTVTDNKVFEEYPKLAEQINMYAAMAYHCSRSANEDFDNRKKEEAEIRIQLQRKTIENCLWLKSSIRLAQKKFHLREKKCTYWTGLVNKALESVKAWNAAEKRTYKENYGL